MPVKWNSYDNLKGLYDIASPSPIVASNTQSNWIPVQVDGPIGSGYTWTWTDTYTYIDDTSFSVGSNGIGFTMASMPSTQTVYETFTFTHTITGQTCQTVVQIPVNVTFTN
jgi:hypothetical protein